MLRNACEIDKQRVNVILRDNVRNMKNSNGWYGGTKHGVRHAYISAGCTRGSAVTEQRHRLTCYHKEYGRPMLQ